MAVLSRRLDVSVPGLSTVQVIRRVPRQVNGAPVHDDRGNLVVDELAPVSVARCSVQPGAAPDAVGEGNDLVNPAFTIYAPPDWPGEEGDLVVIDGRSWRTRGKPQRWPRPGRGHAIVTVERVTG